MTIRSMTIRSKRDLAAILSRLEDFSEPSFQLEQYSTPPSISADWVWNMALKAEVAGKIILDAGCGPGFLGIGLLLMGARKVYFLDKDEKIMRTCMKNYERIKHEYEIGEAEFIVEDVGLFDHEVDIVVENPPFGTKQEHADKKFLEKAFSISSVVYSMHKWSTREFVYAIAKDHGFKITEQWRYDFPIKARFYFHKKPVRSADVGLWRMEKG